MLKRVRAGIHRLSLFAALHRRPLLYVAAFLLHVAIAPFLIHDWDGYVFVQTMRDLMEGSTPYRTVEEQATHVYVGDAVPVVNSWYAYPPVALLLMAPFYAVLTLVTSAPWMERFAIKIPFILGSLLLAYVARRYVEEVLSQDPERARSRGALVEKLLLFNPFLWFITGVWGMFDTWILAFFLLALLLALKERPGLAGVAYGLACLVKPFPALLAPLVAGYFLLLHGRRFTFAFTAATILTGILVSLPFLLDAHQGYLQQILFNHAERPPQGFTIIGFPLTFSWVNSFIGFDVLPVGVEPEAVSAASFSLLLTVLVLLLANLRRIRSETDLAHFVLVGFAGILLVSKVVNEQYFVMPVVAAAVAYSLTANVEHKRILVAYTIGGFVSAFLLGWHFITFFPPDVAAWVFPVDQSEVVPAIRDFFGWNDYQAFVYPTLFASLALVPAFALSVRLVARELVVPLRTLLGRLNVRRSARQASAALLLALILTVPYSAVILTSATAPGPPPPETWLQKDGPLVGTHYYLWWNNPAHDPAIEYGNWRKGVSQVPLEGYYSISAGKMRNDFRLMRESGIDLALFSYHEYDRPKLPAVARLSYEEGILVAPLVELSELYARSEHQARDENGDPVGSDNGLSLRTGTRQGIIEFTSGVLRELERAPSAWRIDGRLVVVYYDSYFVTFDRSGEVRERLIDHALRLADEDHARGIRDDAITREDLEAGFPRSMHDFLGGARHADLFRRAYHEAYREFWSEIRRELEARHGPLHILSGEVWNPEQESYRGIPVAQSGLDIFDGSYIYSPSFAWVFNKTDPFERNYARWFNRHVILAQHERAAGHPVIVSISPGYDDVPLRRDIGFRIPYEVDGQSTYERFWKDAVALEPDVVLVATWNEFYEGTAIEPTREHGSRFLEITREASAEFKATANRDRPTALLVTNYRGSSFEPNVGEPDWTLSLAENLGRAAHTVDAYRFDSVDWNAPNLRDIDLNRYSFVIVDPGPGKPLTDAAAAFPDRLAAYAESGGHVLLLGSYVQRDFARLAPWWEVRIEAANLSLEAPNGPLPIDANDRARSHGIASDAEIRLWMRDDKGRYPALWTISRGEGVVGVTAFRPQGSTLREPTVDVFHLVVESFLAAKAKTGGR